MPQQQRHMPPIGRADPEGQGKCILASATELESATRLDSTLSQELPHALAQVIHLLKKHSDGCSVPSE